MNIEIDKFTPCLEKVQTGEIVKTAYSKTNKTELKSIKNWLFDWNSDELNNCLIFKLMVDGDLRIQGLIALLDEPQNNAVYIKIAESAPHNMGKTKEYSGVGGHLFAIAAKQSVVLGYDGFVYMDAKNITLIEHYAKTFGATYIGYHNRYRMFIDERAARKLINIYTLEEE